MGGVPQRAPRPGSGTKAIRKRRVPRVGGKLETDVASDGLMQHRPVPGRASGAPFACRIHDSDSKGRASMMRFSVRTIGMIGMSMLAAAAADAQPRPRGNATVAGALSPAPPTLRSLAFDWRIEGDDNRNATVELSYRRRGEAAWHQGMPLMRLQREDVNATGGGTQRPQPNGTRLGRPPLYYQVPNMFSGSILMLEPGTEYEARLTMRDPDGVRGPAVRTATVRTRPEPRPAEGGQVYHVYPWNYQGPRQEPAFMGLLAAYYMEARHADWANASPPRVRPGDTILVHAGVYRDTPYHYGDGVEGTSDPRLATEFDGTYYLTADGTAERPIVIRAAGDGEVVFDGGGNAVLFNMMGGDYNYFDGITVRNSEVGFLLGLKNIAGSSGFTLRNSRIENVGRGVMTDWSGSRDFYIVDNVLVGRHPPGTLMGWSGPWSQFPGYPERISGPGGSEYGIKVYGQGHVVAYNTVLNFHDGIDVATYGDPDGAPAGIEDRLPVSMDFYNNYFDNMSDNCIETDGSARNVRVWENFCLNAVSGAFSAQTIFGGPVYFLRNIVYTGVGGSIKFSITPTGVLTYNNTYIATNHATGLASNVHFRNNLFLAHGTQPGSGFSVTTFTNYSSSDYNGYRNARGAEQPFAWNSPPLETVRDFNAAPTVRNFATLEALVAAVGQERHSVLVDYDVFERVSQPTNPDIRHVYDVSRFDFHPRAGGAAIDAGIAIPNVTEGFAGRAPDLGALEAGAPTPHYGTRTAPADGSRR